MATYYKFTKSEIDADETTSYEDYGHDLNFMPSLNGEHAMRVWVSDTKPPYSGSYQYYFPSQQCHIKTYSASTIDEFKNVTFEILPGQFFYDYPVTDAYQIEEKCGIIYQNQTGFPILIRLNVYYSNGEYRTKSEFCDDDTPVSLRAFTGFWSAGATIETLYSLSSSAYPSNGANPDDGYFYSRSTVQSPTAPSGLSYPATITTPSVEVTWTAATSNTNYPVSGYQVDVSTNGGSSWTTAGTPTTNSLTYSVTPGTTSIMFRVRAKDSNGQWGNYVTGTASQVLLAPTLTVPQMVMQGQQAIINWSAIEGADSYTLQRKANTDTDWVQVYSGANITFSETVGTWTSVQYRVQAVFSDTPGGWAESSAIPVVSSSALVISGTDSDLGTVVNDIPYSISSDTGNQITATVKVNGALIFSGNVGNSTADVIPVLDLVSGEGTIIIEASVQASSGTVKATRTWTYTKAPITFPDAGSVAQVTKEGENIFPITLANCVRLPGGNTLDQAMGFPCQIYTGDIYGIKNGDELIFPFTPKTLLVFYLGYLGLFVRGTENMYFSNSSSGCTLEWNENSVRFVRSPFKDNITYTYICLG